jgi:curved DNA-binding protein CbpA
MDDPFTVLGVTEDAGDDQIKQRYLALVRAFPPDREPERFQAYRAAYEALRDQRKRLEAKLLQTNDTALSRQAALPGTVQAGLRQGDQSDRLGAAGRRDRSSVRASGQRFGIMSEGIFAVARASAWSASDGWSRWSQCCA